MPGESGFTLLEVLVTLTVLAVGIALTLSVISGSLANVRKVQLRTRTIQHAETVMELSLLDESIKQPTTLRGDFEDGTRWMVVVSEVAMPMPEQPVLQQRPEWPMKLFAYNVEVYGPDSPTPDLRLRTLKVVNTSDIKTPMRLNP
jgi:prepilin-type N-terminal cleavage/methylation domain-containing protein